MQIENRDAYKKVSIYELGLSTRTLNTLMRANYTTLYQLIANAENLGTIKNMGIKSLEEIEIVLADIFINGLTMPQKASEQETKEAVYLDSVVNELPEDILTRPATDLRISARICSSFRFEGIKTIADVIALTPEKIYQLKNLGTLSQQQLLAEIDALRKNGEDYFQNDAAVSTQEESKYSKREFDVITAKKLFENYGLKTAQLCEWYTLSRQGIYNKLDKKINHGQWCGKELLPAERAVITAMINEKCFFRTENAAKYYLFNNGSDDCAFVVVTDDDIKCFFLTDLPVALQARVKTQKLNVLSESECKAMPTLGKVVHILKKQYFMPTDSHTFRSLAGLRSMTNNEYSMFLFGLPYCTAQTSVTDDRIIAYLKENTVDGRTFIPSTPDNQWIRSYISRNGYSTNDFIELFGFSVTGNEENIDFHFDADDITVVEKDMQVYTAEEGFVEKLFAETPLLGSRLLSEKNLEKLYQNSKKYIGQLLNNANVKANLKAEMQITLAVIHYAKGWDTEDESGFWRYITAQFGYRDDSGQLRNLLCNCIKNALIKNRRWFVTNFSGNMFKSSIMVHAFSTKRSWLHFCDFLFDFYKTNLDWQYIEDDPMFARMVFALRNKFQDAKESDEDIEISTKVYYFREGIIKLIVQRPKYATQLISRLVKRINALINNTAQPASCYEEQLCDEWMAHKIQDISVTKNRISNGEKRKIAIDYTKIRPFYQLVNERDIKIVFPDVRLAKNDFSSLQLSAYYDGKLVEQKSLSFYGNELGKTMSGFSLSLEDYLGRAGAHFIQPQIIISCDNEEIYNSEKNLFRDVLIFKDTTENDIGSCEIGNYSFFVPSDTVIEFINAERSPIVETAFLKGEYVQLQKDFAVSINGELVSFHDDQSTELRVMVPNIGSIADYVSNGIRYSVVSGKETIHIISADRDCEKKYRLAVNDEIVNLEHLPYESNGNARIYKIELDGFGTDELSLRMINFDTNHLVLRRYFKIIPSIAYKFNKFYFFAIEDYRDAKLRIKIGDDRVKEYSVTQGEERLAIPYQNGEIEIPVPVVSFVDNTNAAWTSEKVLFIKDIPQERFIYAKVPSGVNVELLLDDVPVETQKAGTFAIGNTISGYSNVNNRSWLKVYVVISVGSDTTKYCIGKIAAKEQFVQTPILKIDHNTLSWDRGYGFIGNHQGGFKITICCGTEFEQTIPLNLDSDIISRDISLPLGEYPFRIYKQSLNLFAMGLEEIANGSFFIGDENELRFLKHIIKIDTITFEDETRYEAVKIRTCYIDQIEYKGIQYVGTEDRECPVYMGTLFFISDKGKRHEYSFEDTVDSNGHKIYQINPVKIVFGKSPL